MNGDLLSGLFQGKGNSMLTALLPLLLGGKRQGGDLSDMSSLLSALTGGNLSAMQGTPKGEGGASFPPLFGGKEEKGSSAGDVLPILRTLLDPSSRAPAPPSEKTPAPENVYPYELQYNHPDIPHKKLS